MVTMVGYKKILKLIINVFSTILLALLALVVYGKATTIFSSNTYPNYFGYTFFSIASGSMEPALYVNDVILVKIGKEKVKEKDIITYAKDKEIITHRVISISGDTLTVKGDNNNIIDDPINKDQIIGRVIKIFPKLSVWQKVITEPKILIAIFVTFLLFDFALSYKGKEETKEDKNKKVTIGKDKIKEILTNIKEKILSIKDNVAKKIKDIIKKFKKGKKKPKEPIEEEKPIVIKKIEPLVDDLNKTTIIDLDTIKESLKEKQKEEKLENTTILDLNEIEKEMKKEDLEKTTVLDLNKIEKEMKEEKLGYTVRLDLNEINKKIKSKVK